MLRRTIVDLVCEARIGGIEQAEEFKPRFGGALANFAVAASREGAEVELAGGAGDDPWGRWLRSRLGAEGGGSTVVLAPGGAQKPVAFVTFGDDAEPSFQIYGDGIEACVRSVAERLAQNVEHFPEGKELTVKVDPDDPQTAVLWVHMGGAGIEPATSRV